MSKNLGAKPMLVPQPVMMIGTYDADGNANVMNAAWGGIVGANEIIFDLGSHKTTENIKLNKAFTVAIADAEHVAACDYVGIVSANDEPDKMKKAGFTNQKERVCKCSSHQRAFTDNGVQAQGDHRRGQVPRRDCKCCCRRPYPGR